MDTTGGYFATSERDSSGLLVDRPKEQLQAAKDKVIEQQAREGKMPGAMLMSDRMSGANKQETWGNVSADVYDEGAAQASFVTPGLDATGASGGRGGGSIGSQAVVTKGGGGRGGEGPVERPAGGACVEATGASAAGEGAVRQAGLGGKLVDGGGAGGEGPVRQSGDGAGMPEGGGAAGEGAVRQRAFGNKEQAVGSGPGGGA
ncbi:hypothetical protein GPECTOR_2g1588 [Gonium pectorale]|uniref:SMP domain-containing protein n=1 Tax=Gonium pectorale TaxID=33097 RepID=A0A150H1J4_GONPE|nr:hypothetical protein GPECTOR_2g1588 [Gonium pectorale]|eukprot:KXZ56036.1 hypothetical protein GPECTOR_2g1588 [Gonium pectorale]